jgi:hypothetical protein
MIGLLTLLLTKCFLTQGFLFPDNNDWNDLKVTWGINPFGKILNNFI